LVLEALVVAQGLAQTVAIQHLAPLLLMAVAQVCMPEVVILAAQLVALVVELQRKEQGLLEILLQQLQVKEVAEEMAVLRMAVVAAVVEQAQ
jgi:hypothetical protein